MYAGGYITGVYKSVDGGQSWRRMNDGLTNLNVHSIAVDPTNGNRVYAGTMFGGVFNLSSTYAFVCGRPVIRIRIGEEMAAIINFNSAPRWGDSSIASIQM